MKTKEMSIGRLNNQKNKKTVQVLAVKGSEVQLMDMETYEAFHIPNPG